MEWMLAVLDYSFLNSFQTTNTWYNNKAFYPKQVGRVIMNPNEPEKKYFF